MALSRRDVDVLQAAVLDLHEPRDLGALGDIAPGIFMRAIPAEYFLRLEFAHGSLGSLDSLAAQWEFPARSSHALIEAAMRLSADHPFTEQLIRTGELAPMRLSDFWSRRQQLASPIHQQVYRHLGVGRMLAMPIVRGGRPGAINLARSFAAPDFSERDREMLGLLAPHFALAVSAAERASAQQAAEVEALAGLGLTPREREVASWLARGRTNPEIASILATRPRTVEKHVERILVKLDVANRTAAARVVLGLAAVEVLASAPDVARVREAMQRALRPRRARRGR